LTDDSNAHSRSTQILNADQLRRALRRIAHEIVERSGGAEKLALVGIHTRGVPLANRIAEMVGEIEGAKPLVGSLDIALYRDDTMTRGSPATLLPTDVAFDVSDLLIVLIDDVLFTGRTIRAAMDALVDFGRPAAIQLAVLVDRGHRELPIRADYVGKNIPTSRDQKVTVRLAEIDGEDGVFLEEGAA
jgi:pyrimidine operon attenuation protein/uracil phosphoribosyltransferase